MRGILTCAALVALLALATQPAQALYHCVSWGPQDEWAECHPRDGSEPPSWCGDDHGLLGRLRYGWETWQEWVQDQLDRL